MCALHCPQKKITKLQVAASSLAVYGVSVSRFVSATAAPLPDRTNLNPPLDNSSDFDSQEVGKTPQLIVTFLFPKPLALSILASLPRGGKLQSVMKEVRKQEAAEMANTGASVIIKKLT